MCAVAWLCENTPHRSPRGCTAGQRSLTPAGDTMWRVRLPSFPTARSLTSGQAAHTEPRGPLPCSQNVPGALRTCQLNGGKGQKGQKAKIVSSYKPLPAFRRRRATELKLRRGGRVSAGHCSLKQRDQAAAGDIYRRASLPVTTWASIPQKSPVSCSLGSADTQAHMQQLTRYV